MRLVIRRDDIGPDLVLDPDVFDDPERDHGIEGAVSKWQAPPIGAQVWPRRLALSPLPRPVSDVDVERLNGAFAQRLRGSAPAAAIIQDAKLLDGAPRLLGQRLQARDVIVL